MINVCRAAVQINCMDYIKFMKKWKVHTMHTVEAKLESASSIRSIVCGQICLYVSSSTYFFYFCCCMRKLFKLIKASIMHAHLSVISFHIPLQYIDCHSIFVPSFIKSCNSYPYSQLTCFHITFIVVAPFYKSLLLLKLQAFFSVIENSVQFLNNGENFFRNSVK